MGDVGDVHAQEEISEGSRRMLTASSKSWADSPSMVTVVQRR
jgi:hypothetical protein